MERRIRKRKLLIRRRKKKKIIIMGRRDCKRNRIMKNKRKRSDRIRKYLIRK